MRKKKPPGIFARECRDTSREYFNARIANCESLAHLREAVKVEAEGEARKDRIAFINKQIQNLE